MVSELLGLVSVSEATCKQMRNAGLLSISQISCRAVVPNRWVANNSLNSSLRAQIFRTAHISFVCHISKTQTRVDFCEVHMISILIPIQFLHYLRYNSYLVQFRSTLS